jgi:hypothetical protein
MKFSTISGSFVALLALSGPLGCGDHCKAGTGQPTIACKLDALTPAERQRHADLLRELGRMTTGTRETSDGYALTLRSDASDFQRVAEWISLERRCCPFLNFNLKWGGGDDNPSLELGGGPGVKSFLAAEMGW